MRVPLWTLVGLTTANSLTDPIPHGAREIMAQGMTVQFLEEVLSAGSLLGRRKRRQADDTCQDDNPNCNQYTTYCSNGQFLLVCKKTCGKCDGPSDPEPEKPKPSPQKNTSVTSSSSATSSNVSGCVDTMTYCEAMAMYCDNDDYKGVRMYCKKTCNSCNEDFSKYVDGTAPEADDGDGTSPTDDCTEMKYCSGFPFCAESELLKERMQDECPIVCKAEKCRDKWIDSVKTADTTGTTETDYDDCVDGSQSCPGVADLCNQAQYKETLSQYCRATCKLCTPSDNAPADTNKSTPGKCENQFENCDPMKFLCDDKENAYSERYRQMCPVTCGLCSPEAGTSPTAIAPKQEAPSGCQDSANNCGTLLEYCTGAETKEMMQIQCKKSCGFCDAGPPAVETCEDDPAINCGSFLAYCINKNTDVPKKCRKSCGLCPGMTPVTPAPAVVTTRAPTTVATTKAIVTMAPASAAKEPASSTDCKVPTADKMKGCAKYKKFCKAKKYEKKLSSQCAMTCNVCVPIGGGAPATTKAPAAAAGAAGAASGECRDGTPKQCPQLKRYCKVGKYKTMMMKKCKATCGFCGAAAGSAAGTAPAPKAQSAKTPASGEKYGEWSNWSKCDPKSCRQYKRRNCLQQPCAKPDLYNIQKCPADKYPNIAKCQGKATVYQSSKRGFMGSHTIGIT